MSPRSLRAWSWVHTWSSLISTIFLLLLCITGLPLIFHHEIGHLLGTEVEAPAMAEDTPKTSVERMMAAANARHPDRIVQYAIPDEDDDNIWFFTLTPTPAPTDDFRSVAVDARTADVLAQPRFDEGFMWVMLKLHVDLFASLAGKLFLGFMGLLMLVAIVSGVVLYAIADAFATYGLTPAATLRLNVYNLTDKKYLRSVQYGAIYGAPRTVALTLDYKL